MSIRIEDSHVRARAATFPVAQRIGLREVARPVLEELRRETRFVLSNFRGYLSSDHLWVFERLVNHGELFFSPDDLKAARSRAEAFVKAKIPPIFPITCPVAEQGELVLEGKDVVAVYGGFPSVDFALTAVSGRDQKNVIDIRLNHFMDDLLKTHKIRVLNASLDDVLAFRTSVFRGDRIDMAVLREIKRICDKAGRLYDQGVSPSIQDLVKLAESLRGLKPKERITEKKYREDELIAILRKDFWFIHYPEISVIKMLLAFRNGFGENPKYSDVVERLAAIFQDGALEDPRTHISAKSPKELMRQRKEWQSSVRTKLNNLFRANPELFVDTYNTILRAIDEVNLPNPDDLKFATGLIRRLRFKLGDKAFYRAVENLDAKPSAIKTPPKEEPGRQARTTKRSEMIFSAYDDRDRAELRNKYNRGEKLVGGKKTSE